MYYGEKGIVGLVKPTYRPGSMESFIKLMPEGVGFIPFHVGIRAGIAAGADGLIVEVHPHPEEAWSDGAQSLKPEKFAQMVTEVRRVAEAVGRC